MNIKNTLKDSLHKYDMKSLCAYCTEYDIPLDKQDQDALCTALAKVLVEHGVIKMRLGILEDAALNALAKAEQEHAVDDEDLIDALFGLDLIIHQEDGTWRVPVEVIDALENVDDGFHQKRRERVWLMQCLSIVSHYWADAPMHVMQELFAEKEGMDENADLKELFDGIPVSERTCVMINDSFVIRGWRTSEVFASDRDRQKKESFYIPSVEEVEDLYRNDYDSRQENCCIVRNWFLDNGAEEDALGMLLHELWNDMNYGHTETSILDEAEALITFDDDAERESFRQMMHAWYLNARRLALRGHTIIETRMN